MRFSLIKYCTHLVTPLAVLFAMFFFLRGHNQPGGGFIAGLVVATAFVLYAIAFDINRALRLLPSSLEQMFSLGLFLAAFTGVVSVFTGRPFLTSGHTDIELGLLGRFHVVSSTAFDFGVFLVVISVVVGLVFQFALRKCEIYWPVPSSERASFEAAPRHGIVVPLLRILLDTGGFDEEGLAEDEDDADDRGYDESFLTREWPSLFGEAPDDPASIDHGPPEGPKP